MDTLLTLVAAVSLSIAAGMGMMLAKLVRDERRRSEARIAALAETSAEGVAPRLSVPASAGPELFAERDPSSPWGARFAVIGALAAVLVVGGWVAVSRSHRAAGPSAMPPAQAVQAAPLELLSLRYEQQNDRMIITGLVANPPAGASLRHVVAIAFLFGSDGTFLASGRAPLDNATLPPGDQSPFVVAVPVGGTVARYRVGFRDENGQVLAHIDRRAVGTMAARGAR